LTDNVLKITVFSAVTPYIRMSVGSNVSEKYAAYVFRVGVTGVRVLSGCIGMYAFQASRWRLDIPPK